MRDHDKTKKELMLELSELRQELANLKSRYENCRAGNIQLEDSRSHYRLAIENANEAIFIAQDDTLKFVNPKTVDIIGYSVDELMKKPFIEITHPEDRKAILERYQRRIHGEQLFDVYPHRIVDKEGNVKWVEVTVVLISWEGRPATLNFLTDITEKKQAEDELKKSERQLSDIINFLPDATFAIDSNGRVIAWNRAIEQITGVIASDMLGKGNYEYAIPFYGVRKRMLIDLILFPHAQSDEEYRYLRREGDGILAEMSGVLRGVKTYWWAKSCPIYDHRENIVGAIECMRDITQWKLTEIEVKEKTRNLEEANTALKVLLKHREHDKDEIEQKFLMNIKELVMPYIDKLEITPLTTAQAACLEIVRDHLNEVLSPFLIKMTSRHSKFTPREIQVASLIKDGKTTKEIASLLNVTSSAINLHRHHIRDKLDLKNKKVNLQSYLASIM